MAEVEAKPVVAAEEKKEEAPAAVEAAEAPAAESEKKSDEKATENHEAPAEGEQPAAAPAKKEKEMKPQVHKVNFEKDVVYLYQFSRTPALPSLSPYCLKVETWLRLAGLKYEVSKTKFTIKRFAF